VAPFHLQRLAAADLLTVMNLLSCQVSLLVLLFFLRLQLFADTIVPEATNLWTLRFPGAQNSSSSTPAIAHDGTLYVGTLYGDFLAVSPQGDIKWSFDVNCEIHSSPAIADDGTIYFGSRNRKFYAVSPAGKLKWLFATGGWNDSSPAVAADGTVYFGSWDKDFYALNPDGSLKWKFTTGAIVESSPAIAADGTVYFGGHDGNFYALAPDGNMRWKFTTGGGILSSPAIGRDGTTYFTSTDGNLYALNREGTERWRYYSGSATESSPILNERGDVCIGHNQCTQVVTTGGRLHWLSGSAVPIHVSAAAVGDFFYFSVPWRTVEAVKADDQRIWRADMTDNATSSIMVCGNGIVYFCAGTYLYAVRPVGELLPPAKSSWPMFRANVRHTGRVGM
jgi:outer membrane protein assembly factor BamB